MPAVLYAGKLLYERATLLMSTNKAFKVSHNDLIKKFRKEGIRKKKVKIKKQSP